MWCRSTSSPWWRGVLISVEKISTNGNVKKRLRQGEPSDSEHKRGKHGDRRGSYGGNCGWRFSSSSASSSRYFSRQ
jgi:hypothetical protein